METSKMKIVDWDDTVMNDGNVIYGRLYGEEFAKDQNLIWYINRNIPIIIRIDDCVEAINDSFIKGFFGQVFKEYRKKSAISTFFTIEANEYYKRLIDKNWTILEAINYER